MTKDIRLWYLVAGLVIVSVLILSSAKVEAQGVDVGDFVRLGVGGSSLSMGSAYVAVGGDTSTTFWNPGGITELENSRVGGMYTDRFSAGIIYQYLGGIGVVEFGKGPQTPSKKAGTRSNFVSNLAKYNPVRGTVGIGLTRISMNVGNLDYHTGNQVGEKRTLWLGSTGYEFPENSLLGGLSFGASVKRYGRSVNEEKATGWSYDLGMMYKKSLEFGNLPLLGSVGLCIQDPGGVDLDTKQAGDFQAAGTVPQYNRIGLAIGYMSSVPALISLEYDFSLARPQLNRISGGTEVSFAGLFHLRGGISKWVREGNLTFTGGAGFDIGRFSMDYAYMPHAALGGTHVISLDVSF